MFWILYWSVLETLNLVVAISHPNVASVLSLAFSSFFLGIYMTANFLAKKTLGEIIVEEIIKKSSRKA